MKQIIILLVVSIVISCTQTDPEIKLTKIEGEYACMDVFYSKTLHQNVGDSFPHYVYNNYSKNRTIVVTNQENGNYMVDQNLFHFNYPLGYSNYTKWIAGSSRDSLYVDGFMFFLRRQSITGDGEMYQLIMGEKID
jgi:hypothetical protein